MNKASLKPIFSASQINEKVRQLGTIISKDYRNLDPILIGVLNGSCMFLSDLARSIKINHEIDFIKISSYPKGRTAREISLINDLSTDISERAVIIVEDIIDTGKSLAYLKKYLGRHKPKSLKTCTLIDKKERREIGISADYKVFDVDGGFLVGYGMDYNGWGRNLNGIYELSVKGE